MRFRVALALAVATGLLIIPTSASAAFHLMKISEVHEAGVTGGADYIELQMHAAGQRFVGGHYVRTYDGGGAEFETYLFPSDVANGDNQRTILLAAEGTIGVTPDFVATGIGNLFPGPSGTVCFLDSLPSAGIDCVSIGNPLPPTGMPSPVGNPALFPGGLLDGQSVHRTIAPNCSTLLEAADDSNDSVTDFALGTPSPRPNSVTPTETACTSGGNGLTLKLSGKKTQKAGNSVFVKASCGDTECTVKAKGKIKLSTGKSSATGAAKRSVKLKPTTKSLDADSTKKLKLRVKKSAKRALKKALKSGGKEKAKITVKATGPLGEKDTAKRTVKLK